MKRGRPEDNAKEASGPPLPNTSNTLTINQQSNQQQQQNSNAVNAVNTLYRAALPNPPQINYPTPGTVKILSEGMQSAGIYTPGPPVSYSPMPVVGAPHSGRPQAMSMATNSHNAMRTMGASPPSVSIQEPPQQQSPSNFQRLKVEDALSYLDLVKFKFGAKPQVYNDFLDIMKEFKSQSIDTPGVIHRVSNLFKGFPDLIVGFNTFLPPGYKIEVQKTEQGNRNLDLSIIDASTNETPRLDRMGHSVNEPHAQTKA